MSYLLLLLLPGIFHFIVPAFSQEVTLTNDGPCVKGGRIVFTAELYNNDGTRPSGTYSYKWRDNALQPQRYESPWTYNTTAYWTVDYPAEIYAVGEYTAEVIVYTKYFFIPDELTSRRVEFSITNFLNGNISVAQANKSLNSENIAAGIETKIDINLRKNDEFYVKNNLTQSSTFWFVDCKYYGMTEDLSFNYTFAKPDTNYTIEALIIASNDPLTTTTVAPITTTPALTTTTTKSPNVTSLNLTKSTVHPAENLSTTIRPNPSTLAPTISTTAIIPPGNATSNATNSKIVVDGNGEQFGNTTFPFVCLNSSVIPQDPSKTYGYFRRDINARAPISNITVEGTNWIQPWDMLSLKVACHGSGPFEHCLQFHRGEYNVTGQEKCDNPINLKTCNFSIVHYFLEPSVYTILVILDNEVSTQIYPLTINIYKVSKKPQLSVIIVPVSCSLAAAVLIIFGVAYYIQSRARFTIEVADFDFGQNNPEMEYKTFTERLRDSLNNTGYKQLSNPGRQWEDLQERDQDVRS